MYDLQKLDQKSNDMEVGFLWQNIVMKPSYEQYMNT